MLVAFGVSPPDKVLMIENRVGIQLREAKACVGIVQANDALQQGNGILLTLIMPDAQKEDFLLQAKVFVVMYLTGDERITILRHGFINKEVTGATTQRHSRYWPVKHGIGHHTIHDKLLLHHLREVLRAHRRAKQSHYTGATTIVVVDKETHIRHIQMLRHAVTHAVGRVVQVGVGGIDCNAVKDGQPYAALHIRIVRHTAQGMKQQGVVRNHHIAALFLRLHQYGFGNVQTQQNP